MDGQHSKNSYENILVGPLKHSSFWPSANVNISEIRGTLSVCLTTNLPGLSFVHFRSEWGLGRLKTENFNTKPLESVFLVMCDLSMNEL